MGYGRCGGVTLDSFANATAKQINEGFSDGLFLLLAAYRWCPNVLTAVALDFIAIDFWVPRARLYAIRPDFLPLTLSPSRSRDYFCKLLINRHASQESAATRKGDIIPDTTRWLRLRCLALHRDTGSGLKLVPQLCGDLEYSSFLFGIFSPSVMMIIPHNHIQKHPFKVAISTFCSAYFHISYCYRYQFNRNSSFKSHFGNVTAAALCVPCLCHGSIYRVSSQRTCLCVDS